MKFAYRKFLSVSLAVSVLVLVAGCGKNEDNGNAQPPVGTGSGQNTGGGGGTGTGTGTCPSIGNGINMCVYPLSTGPLSCTPTSWMPCTLAGIPDGFSFDLGINWSDSAARFPRVGSIYNDLQVYPIGFQVYANDLIVFTGEGGYGEATDKSECDGGDLKELKLSGKDSNGILRYGKIASQPAALLARVSKVGGGTPDYYNIGDPLSLGTAVISAPGYLSWGINSPYDYNCHYLRVDQLEIHRCTDSSGSSVVCPF